MPQMIHGLYSQRQPNTAAPLRSIIIGLVLCRTGKSHSAISPALPLTLPGIKMQNLALRGILSKRSNISF